MKQSLDQFPTLVQSLGDATVSTAQTFNDVDDQLRQGFASAME